MQPVNSGTIRGFGSGQMSLFKHPPQHLARYLEGELRLPLMKATVATLSLHKDMEGDYGRRSERNQCYWQGFISALSGFCTF